METVEEENVNEFKFDSLEYLICYLRFTKNAPKELLLNLLQKIPADLDEFLSAIRTNNFATVSNQLATGPPRRRLPTAPWYNIILDAFFEESDPILAENLIRYLLFFEMKRAHETAIPYLIEQYKLLKTEEDKKIMINPYCWNAKYIQLGRDGY